MPAVLVDVRSPAASSSPFDRVRPLSTNPTPGEFPTSFASRITPYPGPSGVSDRSDIGQNFDLGGRFTSPTPPVSSIPSQLATSSSEPSQAAGLSKPRLAKLKKHAGANRARARVTVNPDCRSGCNSFHSRPVSAELDTSKGNQVGEAHGLQEKLDGWNPFKSDTGLTTSEGSVSDDPQSAKVESAGFVMNDVGAFVFGGIAKKDPSFGRSTGKKFPKSDKKRYPSHKSVKHVRPANALVGGQNIVSELTSSKNLNGQTEVNTELDDERAKFNVENTYGHNHDSAQSYFTCTSVDTLPQVANYSTVKDELGSRNEEPGNPAIAFVFGDRSKKTASVEMLASDVHSPNTHSKFTFRACKQDNSLHKDDIHSSETDNCCRLKETAKPFDLSSSAQIHSPATGFSFTGGYEELKSSQTKFKGPVQVNFGLSKESLFTRPSEHRAFNVKKGRAKTGRNTRRDKFKQSLLLHKNFSQASAPAEKLSETIEQLSPAGWSPMDYSPYHEGLVVDQDFREISVTSNDESHHIISNCETIFEEEECIPVEPVERTREESIPAPLHLDAIDDSVTLGKVENNGSRHDPLRNLVAGSSVRCKQSKGLNRETYVFASKDAKAEADTNPCSPDSEPQDTVSEKLSTLSSSLKGSTCSDFTFVSLPFDQGSLPVSKHVHRMKSRKKGSKTLNNSTRNHNVSAPFLENALPVHAASSGQPLAGQDQRDIPSVTLGGDDVRQVTERNLEEGNNLKPKVAASVEEQEACDLWRQRGNRAYSNGDMSKAEEFYTRGLNSIHTNKVRRSGNRALMLCYSNRAAARMSLGRMKAALSDCMMAVAIDSSFIKAQLRAANCLLSLGEVEDAAKLFKRCLEQEDNNILDQKILNEASDGLRKTQKVAGYIIQSDGHILKRSSVEASRALQLICEALLICPYCDRLMARKAEALLMLRNYEELIQFCEQTIDMAENIQNNAVKLWRWRLMSKSYFYLGKLEEAFVFLKKHADAISILDKNDNDSTESLASLFDAISELLRLKAAGNEAFQAGKHQEAVEHYSSALACNSESHPFTAICFSNRAAAYQALGQITDAIADCSIAIALDPSYPKAISRRATLHEMIRDYAQAANDLRRLVSLLEKQVKDNNNRDEVSRRISCYADVNGARLRLRSVEEEAKKETTLNLYMILGLELSSSSADIKKSYRKAALRHHPDKAGQFITRTENFDDDSWKQMAIEVQKDADRLFKMIGEAYSVLSDPAKRLIYDDEEATRSMVRKGCSARQTSKPHESYNNPYDTKSSPYERREYGRTRHRWTDSPHYYK
ncbi:uncharacterized protein LOC121988743 isoform X1 [Zingiber officinale]|uniref:J domain-containing protein n=1 Tax=Zingiber officinale TaxID=94328 RepID=A0A8J5G6A5_ZINOF|nr:uncharacterized protein LOC121988743 isoform X1 [Zingiber officinale]KAG6497173.1 hypothetical protein ZIOFF_045062 [Zingiber officinale]